jgi:hypothetical protein
LKYKYCFAWGSKAIKYKNEQNDSLSGINGDLVMLDLNFRSNGISSIVRYDKFSGVPYIKNVGTATTDIDLLEVFAKPLVKCEVATALLGYGKLNRQYIIL